MRVVFLPTLDKDFVKKWSDNIHKNSRVTKDWQEEILRIKEDPKYYFDNYFKGKESV